MAYLKNIHWKSRNLCDKWHVLESISKAVKVCVFNIYQVYSTPNDKSLIFPWLRLLQFVVEAISYPNIFLIVFSSDIKAISMANFPESIVLLIRGFKQFHAPARLHLSIASWMLEKIVTWSYWFLCLFCWPQVSLYDSIRNSWFVFSFFKWAWRKIKSIHRKV